jgi:hypothetical protein
LKLQKTYLILKYLKKTTIKRIKKTINKENTDDKREISKIKAQNLTMNLLNYFNINVPENLII